MRNSMLKFTFMSDLWIFFDTKNVGYEGCGGGLYEIQQI